MTDYLVASDLELAGPAPELQNLRFAEGSWEYVQVVRGLENANKEAAEIGAKHPNHGVTVYKVVEVAHYKPVHR